MIRPARELAGITLRELAGRIGVSVGTMSAIETGKTAVAPERLDGIAAALGTTSERLARFEPLPAPTPRPFDWRVYPDLDLDPVLRAAIACFARTGYHGATMRTVAAEAGISVPGVYHHYANKRALLDATFDLALAELRAHLPAARDEATEPVARLENICQALVLFATTRSTLVRVITTEDRDAIGTTGRGRALEDEPTTLLRTEIDAGTRRGTLDVDDSDEAARAILELCLSTCRLGCTHPDGHPDSRCSSDAAGLARRYARYAVRLAGGG